MWTDKRTNHTLTGLGVVQFTSTPICTTNIRCVGARIPHPATMYWQGGCPEVVAHGAECTIKCKGKTVLIRGDPSTRTCRKPGQILEFRTEPVCGHLKEMREAKYGHRDYSR